MDLASTIVAIMVSYLRPRKSQWVRGAPGPAADPAGSLYVLVSGRLADDGALRTLAQEAATGSPT